jgi:hypothetical protein
MAQHRGQWQALVNMIMKLQAPYNSGNFLNSTVCCYLPQGRLSFMDFVTSSTPLVLAIYCV